MNDDTGLPAVQATAPGPSTQFAQHVCQDEDRRPDKLLHLAWQILRNGDMAKRAAWLTLFILGIAATLVCIVFIVVKGLPVWTFTGSVIAASGGGVGSAALVARWVQKKKRSARELAEKEPKVESNL